MQQNNKYFYDKLSDCFRLEQKYGIDGIPLFVEYTKEEYDALFNHDEFHYVAQDPETGLPRLMEISNEDKAAMYRKRRERICFPIINRGQLWYSRLTDEQRSELNAWYTAWLNVTETLDVPDKLAWLE